MGQERLAAILRESLADLERQGRRKGAEKVITGLIPPSDGKGPRCRLAGYGDRQFLRLNSNSYLGLSLHPRVIAAEEEAARAYGTGPGAVRFISGTYAPHVRLEAQLAAFHGRPAAMLYSAAYAAVMGVIPPLVNEATMVVSDALNHNSIINALRLAKPAGKLIYRHLDLADLEARIRQCAGRCRRLLVISDGIFSMRGDHAPLAAISDLCHRFQGEFAEGIVTIIDDSHGVGACGAGGRGVEEITGARADLLIATLGKGLGVNGGYVVAAAPVIDYLRETSPFYIYSNPITPSEAAAAGAALAVLDSPEGRQLLARLHHLAGRFRQELSRAGFEVLAGDHPIVPLMVRDTARTAALVEYLFTRDILVTGLNYPVVPRGDEEIRFQIAAGHTEEDLGYVLGVLDEFSGR